MSEEYMLSTVVEFHDRAEGQVLCRGTKDECEKLSALMPAIMVNGNGETPTKAWHLIVLASNFADLKVGQAWVARRPASNAEVTA